MRKISKYKQYICEQPCLVSMGCEGMIEPHHVRSRGAGGKDEGNLVPLCTKHHVFGIHIIGKKTFEKMFDLDLDKEAKELWEKYRKLVKK